MNLFIRSISKIKSGLNKVFNRSLRTFELQPNVTVGKYTYGVENMRISWGGGAKVVIGSFTSIAANLQIQMGGNHNSQSISTYPFGHVREKNKVLFGPPIMNHPVAPKSVHIGNDVWIGNNVTSKCFLENLFPLNQIRSKASQPSISSSIFHVQTVHLLAISQTHSSI